MAWTGLGTTWIGLDWGGLDGDWTGLDWIGMDWIACGLDQIGLVAYRTKAIGLDINRIRVGVVGWMGLELIGSGKVGLDWVWNGLERVA